MNTTQQVKYTMTMILCQTRDLIGNSISQRQQLMNNNKPQTFAHQ